MINSEFLQSKEWAAFQRAQGHQVIELDGKFLFKKKMRFGFLQLYAPRIEADEKTLLKLDETAKSNSVDFIRFEPSEITPSVDLKKSGYQRVNDHQPSHTLLIDLKKEKGQLLTEMHSKARYNIRLAEKKGVICRTAGLVEYEKFWKLISATYGRKEISTHSENYYRQLMENCPGAYLAFAEFEGQIIVANLMMRYGDTVTYLHGGSDNFFKHLMAPHLLQWFEIERAKDDGFSYYDFGGIAPDDDPKHPWAGITRFKKGFGGFIKHYSGTWEKGMTWRYSIYRLLTKFR